MYNSYRIVTLLGKGIGTEVVEATLKILERGAKIWDFNVGINYGLIGEPAKQKFANYLPPTTIELCKEADSILFSPVSKGGLLELGEYFDFYLNLRPIKTNPSITYKSSLKPEKIIGVDILFARELVSSIYFGISKRDRDQNGNYINILVLMLEEWGGLAAKNILLKLKKIFYSKAIEPQIYLPNQQEF